MDPDFLKIAQDAATNAGSLLAEKFTISKTHSFKSDHDLVSEMDKISESVIIKIISKRFPDHSIFSEESGMSNKFSQYCWYIDPLDGTNNYAAGIPYFSISIALLYDKQAIVGVVYNPISKQLFWAVQGQGAFLNGIPISPAKLTETTRATLSFIRGHGTYDAGLLNQTSQSIEQLLTPQFRRKITMWAPALDWCLLAAGGIDALVSFESELEDQYAGTLICQEAGVGVVDFSGADYNPTTRRIIAANKNLTKQLIHILKPFN
jgi:myo-inositol-1(or 4)-monophosphatase